MLVEHYNPNNFSFMVLCSFAAKHHNKTQNILWSLFSFFGGMQKRLELFMAGSAVSRKKNTLFTLESTSHDLLSISIPS